MDMEATVMELIINAGESRSLAMQALQAARKGVWQDVDRLTSMLARELIAELIEVQRQLQHRN
ncbi:TPA: PTS lactose/cellobiose transporter subunit IIA [Klebsiella pneumoniae]